MKKSNIGVDYYIEVGSYHGAIKIRGRWERALNLNHLDKKIFKKIFTRWQGPPSKSICRALNESPKYDYKKGVK